MHLVKFSNFIVELGGGDGRQLNVVKVVGIGGIVGEFEIADLRLSDERT